MASKETPSLSISYFTENILDRILPFSQLLKESDKTLKNVKNVYFVSFYINGDEQNLEMRKKNSAMIEEAVHGRDKKINIYNKEFNLGSELNPSNVFNTALDFLSLLTEENICVYNHEESLSTISLLHSVLLSYLEGIQLEKCLQLHQTFNIIPGTLLELRVIVCKMFSVRKSLLSSPNFSLIPVPTFVLKENQHLELDSEFLSQPPFKNSCWVIQGRLLIGSSISPENISSNKITAIFELSDGKNETNHTQSLIFHRLEFNTKENFANLMFTMVLRVVGLIESDEKIFIAYKEVDDGTFLACIFGILHGIPPLNALELAGKFHKKCGLPKKPHRIDKIMSIIKSLQSYKLTLRVPAEVRENYTKLLSNSIPPLAKETDPVMGPIESSHWVIFNHLIAGSNPDSYRASETTLNLEQILAAGVTVFVNLQENYEQVYFAQYKNEVVEIARTKYQRELQFISLEIEDMNVTSDENILGLVFKITSLILGGHCVYVHCWGGFGRTGTVMALLISYLYGKDAETCLKLTTSLSQKRVCCWESSSPTTSVQFNQVRRIAPILNPKNFS